MKIHSYANSPSSLLQPKCCFWLILMPLYYFVMHTHIQTTHSSHFLVTGPECLCYAAYAAGIKTDTCHQSAGPCAHCCPLWILIAHCNYVVPLVILRMQWWAAGYTYPLSWSLLCKWEILQTDERVAGVKARIYAEP